MIKAVGINDTLSCLDVQVVVRQLIIVSICMLFGGMGLFSCTAPIYPPPSGSHIGNSQWMQFVGLISYNFGLFDTKAFVSNQ